MQRSSSAAFRYVRQKRQRAGDGYLPTSVHPVLAFTGLVVDAVARRLVVFTGFTPHPLGKEQTRRFLAGERSEARGSRFGRWISRLGLYSTVSLACQLSPSEALANSEERVELRWNRWADGAVLSGSLFAVVGMQLLQDGISPSTCRWCAENRVDESARHMLKWNDVDTASWLSHAGLAIQPVAVLGTMLGVTPTDRRDEFAVNALLVLEAAFVSLAVNEFVKVAVARRRPYVQDAPERWNSSHNRSFYSNAASWTFSVAVSAGTIASMRHYRHADLVWATGLPLAASVAYLRIAADKHYLSDVATGAVAGSLFGFLVPFLFHRPLSSTTPAVGTSSSALLYSAPQMSLTGNW